MPIETGWTERANALLDVFDLDNLSDWRKGDFQSGIYILVDRTGTPIYIGQSVDIDRRIKAHRYSHRFSFDGDHIKTVHVKPELRYPVEMALIGLLKPRANGIWTRWGAR